VTFAVAFLIWLGIAALTAVYMHGDPAMLALVVLAGIVGFWMLSRMAQPRRAAPKRTKMPPRYEIVAQKIDAIEAEMKRIGYWQDAPLTPEQYDFRAAFAADTMAFPQWLQFIFIPNVRAIVARQGAFPASSQVGAYAVREFDTYGDEVDNLTTLLIEFDRLF
jgi:uncharacterized protein YqcC (DUF446 family)